MTESDKTGVPLLTELEDLQQRTAQYQQAADRLKWQLGFETLLSALSAQFVNLPPEEVDSAISLWLERICLFLEVDRGGIHQFSEDGRDLVVTHSYSVPGVIEVPKIICSDLLPWFTSQVRAGEVFKAENSLNALPPDALAERRYVIDQGSKSTIGIPLKIGGRVLGAVVFGTLRDYHTWPDDLVQRMKLLGEVFANAFMRKRFEEALRESRERFRRAFEHAAVGICIFDSFGRFLEVNSSFCHLLGYGENELLGMSLEDITHPDDREITLKRINQALAGDIQYIWLEKRYVHRDGHSLWVYVSSTLVRKPDGSPLYFVAHTQDISESKRSRELLEETNTALKVVLDRQAQDRQDTEKDILATLENLVFPYLEKLDATPLDREQQTFLNLLRKNLGEIASPFARRLSSLQSKLTPTELQVADLIKRGRTSQEIASLLHMSDAAVYFHRNNIRKKLGLLHKKTNLRSFLMDLS